MGCGGTFAQNAENSGSSLNIGEATFDSFGEEFANRVSGVKTGLILIPSLGGFPVFSIRVPPQQFLFFYFPGGLMFVLFRSNTYFLHCERG